MILLILPETVRLIDDREMVTTFHSVESVIRSRNFETQRADAQILLFHRIVYHPFDIAIGAAIWKDDRCNPGIASVLAKEFVSVPVNHGRSIVDKSQGTFFRNSFFFRKGCPGMRNMENQGIVTFGRSLLPPEYSAGINKKMTGRIPLNAGIIFRISHSLEIVSERTLGPQLRSIGKRT